MSENMRGIEKTSNMPTQRERAQSDPESRLNNNIQGVKNDLEKDVQTVKDDLKKDIQTVKNDLEKDIDDIKATLKSIEKRLRDLETSDAVLQGRKIAFSSIFSAIKDWIVAICAIAALVISIIALKN